MTSASDAPVSVELLLPRRFKPFECPHCKYDRKFPETQGGGWMYLGNNGPYVCCPMCNPDGSYLRGG